MSSKAMKLALELSFYLKIKKESNCLIDMVRMIEKPYPVCCPLLVTLGSISKNHEIIVFFFFPPFFYHLDYVIVSFDPH